MSNSKWVWIVIVALLGFSLAACDTYTYLPTRSRTVPPPTSEPGAAPGASPQPAAQPDLNQRLQDLEARLARMENRLGELEGSKPSRLAEPTARPEKTAKPSGPPAGYPPATGSSDKHFTDGMSHYQAKKYGLAREDFYKYLKQQPKGAKAPEARYYLADSFYQDKQYKEAAVEFNKLATRHPDSILAPAALLRQALSYNNQQKKRSYRLTLEKLIKNYPQSPEAKEAQKWLKEEGGAKPKTQTPGPKTQNPELRTAALR